MDAKRATEAVSVMAISLYEHQKSAVDKLKTGSILVGGVGSGKSRVALAYYFVHECGGKIKTNQEGGYSPMRRPKDLYIITTARKRDTLEWEQECCPFLLSTNPAVSVGGVRVVIDSWNNIGKYTNVKGAFFIFDEQRVIGNGAWVKSFLKITPHNGWILLSATPGDTWLDYIPVFLANGFYKNRTDFLRKHVVFRSFSRYPKIEHYLGVSHLTRLKEQITVVMQFTKHTIAHTKVIRADFDKLVFNTVLVKRWNVFEARPVKDVGELCYLLRRVVNTDPSRLDAIRNILAEHPRLVVFYNFNYEREALLDLGKKLGVPTAQWNGHRHEALPTGVSWLYLVQYTAGAEGWNCIETNAMVFFSQNYSYRATIQAAGRIDRLNTPYTDLFYYHLRSNSVIDLAIQKALQNKKDFNEARFMSA